MDINSCSNHTAFDFPYLYLKYNIFFPFLLRFLSISLFIIYFFPFRCYVDEFRDCETQEECEDSGTCSGQSRIRQKKKNTFNFFILLSMILLDVEYSRNVNQVGSWFSVTYGVCLTSGIGGSTLDKDPFCFHGFGEFDYPFGCLNRYMTSEVYFDYYDCC